MTTVAYKRGEYIVATRWTDEQLALVQSATKAVGLMGGLRNIQQIKKLPIDECKLTFDQMKAMLLL